MLATRTSAALRTAFRPQQVRFYHVENVVGHNMPFKYEGASRKVFAAKIIALMGFGMAVPFIAAGYQLRKASA